MAKTPEDFERLQIELYRQMSPVQKLKIVFDLNAAAEALHTIDVRSRYPNASEREIRIRVASRRIPPDLMKKFFDWDVEKEGY